VLVAISEKEYACPFCGSDRHRILNEDPGISVKILQCLDCGQKFPVKSE
jgi:transcription elongation factor Elf1